MVSLIGDPLWRPPMAVPLALVERMNAHNRPAEAWALLYQRDPFLYDTLVEGEPLHPRIFRELPLDGAAVLDVGAGTGRLTFPCAARAAQVYALEPVAAMRGLLEQKVLERGITNITAVVGHVQDIPLPDRVVDLVVSASSFGADPACGGDDGLRELRRVARPGGQVVIIWPDDPHWFLERGFAYHAFGGDLEIRFRDRSTAERCAAIFYSPSVADYIRRTGRPIVPFEVTGINAPRDFCRMTVV